MEQTAFKALVVDDNPRWLKTLTLLIRSIGYSVSTAQTYAEALSEVETSQVSLDLIVTDIRLMDNDESNIDGLRLLMDLHKRGRLRASIVVTGYPSSMAQRIVEKLGAGYLEKGSFDKEGFQRELERITHKSERIELESLVNSSQCVQFRGCFALAT